jgi:hypothetical protein
MTYTVECLAHSHTAVRENNLKILQNPDQMVFFLPKKCTLDYYYYYLHYYYISLPYTTVHVQIQ